MMRVLCLALVLGVVLSEKPEFGSQHCQTVLATDCSGYTPEPVCAFDGTSYVTYQNSCEFAKGICTHHGHSLHAVHEGSCGTSTSTP
ncbi:uncharacterized protein LOC128229901 [Mya arenaria]|uniref:uncharacterized protein LOC128229901 n=1 Tax=Mya arenaria TaxID=6604 RepID=UPI0022E1796B|nr:uncharacterized protein LOC128229901 [Mya arenaria]